MDFILAVIKILVGSFLLFTIANKSYATLGQRSQWSWVALIGALAVANMVLHRLIGSTINPPFFTAFCFGVLLAGMSPKESIQVSPWIKRAIYAVVIGTGLGWLSYAEVHTAR